MPVNQYELLSQTVDEAFLCPKIDGIQWDIQSKAKKYPETLQFQGKKAKKWYRRWDLNPHVLGTPDFESSASAIPPLRHILVAGPGLEPGTCGL